MSPKHLKVGSCLKVVQLCLIVFVFVLVPGGHFSFVICGLWFPVSGFTILFNSLLDKVGIIIIVNL